VWTDTIFSYFNNPDYFDMSTSKGNITWENFTGMKAPKKVGDVIVLPITSFSPGVKTMGAGEDDDPMAFVKHNFEGMHIIFCRFPNWSVRRRTVRLFQYYPPGCDVPHTLSIPSIDVSKY
jgi:hypothetical protein